MLCKIPFSNNRFEQIKLTYRCTHCRVNSDISTRLYRYNNTCFAGIPVFDMDFLQSNKKHVLGDICLIH